MLLALIAA